MLIEPMIPADLLWQGARWDASMHRRTGQIPAWAGSRLTATA
ncbi:MAG TPA: hypothetical protein VK191_00965 [Symbiobacteriaceae bacterium]|nr:hypothetical protein [Symbiobacteriaceae bacterium]